MVLVADRGSRDRHYGGAGRRACYMALIRSKLHIMCLCDLDIAAFGCAFAR